MTNLSLARPLFLLTTAIAGLFRPPSTSAAEPYAGVTETTAFDSNVYSDASEEWDMVIEPALSLGIDFADIYSVGYDGRLEVYPRHRNLLYHTHELFFLMSPTFGKNDENSLTTELSVVAQRNDNAYADINLLEPTLFAVLSMSPRSWLTWELSETVSYRWFYDDTASDGIDSWSRGEITFTPPSRTTIKPRVIYGQRYYPRLTGNAADDRLDQQLEAGLRIGQNLFEGAGVRLDYAYIHGFGTSATVRRNIDETAFQYLGEAFLVTAHQLSTGLKLVFENGIGIDTALMFADKTYNGWPARDDFGDPTGETRHDRELGPFAQLSYTHLPKETAGPGVPELEITLAYQFERNWSNDLWYDTDRHRVWLGFELFW